MKWKLTIEGDFEDFGPVKGQAEDAVRACVRRLIAVGANPESVEFNFKKNETELKLESESQ